MLKVGKYLVLPNKSTTFALSKETEVKPSKKNKTMENVTITNYRDCGHGITLNEDGSFTATKYMRNEDSRNEFEVSMRCESAGKCHDAMMFLTDGTFGERCPKYFEGVTDVFEYIVWCYKHGIDIYLGGDKLEGKEDENGFMVEERFAEMDSVFADMGRYEYDWDENIAKQLHYLIEE